MQFHFVLGIKMQILAGTWHQYFDMVLIPKTRSKEKRLALEEINQKPWSKPAEWIDMFKKVT